MFGKKKSTVGLHIGSSSIKVVEIAHDRSGDRLINFGISEPLSEAIVDGEIMDRQLVHEAIANLIESRQIRNRVVATAVSGRAVIVKKILMDRLSEADAKEAIQDCGEANYDLRPDEVVALVNIGAEITNVNIVQDQVPHFTKDLSVGSNAFVEGIQRRYNVSQPDALSALRGRGDSSIDVAPI